MEVASETPPQTRGGLLTLRSSKLIAWQWHKPARPFFFFFSCSWFPFFVCWSAFGARPENSRRDHARIRTWLCLVAKCHTNHESRPGSTIAMVGFLALSGTLGALHDTSPSGKLGTVCRSARARHKESRRWSLGSTTVFTTLHLTSQRHQSVRSPPSRLPLYPGVTSRRFWPRRQATWHVSSPRS